MAENIVVTDLDDTLIMSGGKVNEAMKAKLLEEHANGLGIVIVSGRNIDRIDETTKWLVDNEVPHQAIFLSDFPQGPNASKAFKLYKAQKLLDDGYIIEMWYENDADTRTELIKLGINVESPEVNDNVNESNNTKAVSVPEYVIENAKKGLEYYEQGYAGDGLVSRTISEARDMANGIVSDDKVKRIAPWIARHLVDLEAPKNNDRNDPEYPGAGLVAMLLWGAGPDMEGAERTQKWAENEIAKIESIKNINTNLTVKEQKLMQTKTFKADIEVKAKEANADAPYGSFTALVSVFNNTDLVNDRIIPGAFADSLASFEASGKTLPIVWSHDWSNADSFIGKTLSAVETEDGLLVNAAFFNTPKAQHIRELLTEKVVSEFSFAYDVIDQQTAKDGVNELLKLNILEAGPTLKGANPSTQLVSAKKLPKNYKAEPGELQEGSFVRFENGYGRVEYIMTEGSFGVENDPLSLEATPDNPLAMVRIYQEIDETYIATDLFRGFRFSELETAEEIQNIEESNIENPKGARTLSSKNEGTIRKAKEMLNDVLISLENKENSDQAKSEESEQTKVEEHVLDAYVALNLLTIEDLDNN